MPGVFVAVGEFSRERLSAAVKKLENAPAHRSEITTISPHLAVGWAGPQECIDHQGWATKAGDEVYVWQYGHACKATPQPARIRAAEILGDYMSHGVETCYAYEGSFVILIVDLRLQRLYVVPDRLCTQPLYHARAGDAIVLGPEVKALCTAIGTAPSLSRDALVGFLSAGYNIGTQTLFTDIQKLEMGKMLEIGIDHPRRLSAHRFWKLEFSSTDKFTRRRDAENALFQSIVDAHRLMLADEPSFQILLSGGADARGMLGACNLLDAHPARAVCWGFLKEAPRSDASISRSLAERFGIPWDFIAMRTDTFVDNCEHWAYVSELSNDNFGWYSEGFGTLVHLHETGHPCSLIGDESWGWHGFAYDEFQAYSKVLPATVPASLLALMIENRRETAASAYVNNIRDVMRDCHDTDWTDRKDFFYLHARVARFIFALGYYRGHVLEQRRPFLTRSVLDVVRRMPAEYRVHKNLYLTMLERRFPGVARVPYASVNSLLDWNYDLRTNARLRDFFLELLNDPVIETGALGDLIDMGRFRALRDAFFTENPAPIVRQARASDLARQYVRKMLWRHPFYKHVDRWSNSHQQMKRSVTIAPIDILRRVAILVLLERQLCRFSSS